MIEKVNISELTEATEITGGYGYIILPDTENPGKFKPFKFKVEDFAGGVGLGETALTAYRGDRGKAAYDHSQAAHAEPIVVYKPITQPVVSIGTPNILTLDCNNSKRAVFEPRKSVGTLSIDVDIDVIISNSSVCDDIYFALSLTGTRIIKFSSDVICSYESTSGIWNASTQQLTLATTTDEIVQMQLVWYATNSKWILTVGEKA